MCLQQGLCPLRRRAQLLSPSSSSLLGLAEMSDWHCITGIVCSMEPLQWGMGMPGLKSVLSVRFPTPLQYLIAGVPMCAFCQ